jgi:chromosome segregation ATPase
LQASRLRENEETKTQMSDDPILAALNRLEAGQAKLETNVAKLEANVAKLEAEQERLRDQLNTKLDNILDRLSANRLDTDTVRGHVLYGLQENLILSQRITKIEEELRR